ncbi:MAG: squalene synthase HpnC [Betaproteobacteria bacterium]|nr:squalene synthase HpnC [Betaproteobacteria bacterium]
MAVGHYENFPVASLLLPAHLRRPVGAIYRFARSADDIADEGDFPAPVRLQGLAHFDSQLTLIERRERVHEPLFEELATMIDRFRLPIAPFRDLLSAFSQDCVKPRYADFAELLDYSRRSANPIGRLLLHLFDADAADTAVCSDRICTALQLINFWQDVAIDYTKGRIYLPLDDMRHFAVTEAQLGRREADAAFRALMRHEVERTRRLLHDGAALGHRLRGRIGLEIRMVIAGGDTILHKLIAADYDVFRRRPVLRAWDWISMLARALGGDGRISARYAA